jgi:hypothetical protein
LFAATTLDLPVSRNKQRQLLVERRDAFARIDNPNQRDCFVDRDASLLENVCGDHRFVVRHNPARIDEREPLPVPIAFAIHSIARDAWLVADNRTPLANQPVE